MATSGYRDEYVTKWDTLRFSWSRTDVSIANNTSTVSWSLQLIAGAYGRIDSSPLRAWNVTVNGSSYSGSVSVDIGNNATKTLASGTTIIPHNADGTKSFSYSFSQYFAITFSGNYIGTVSGSSSGTLDSIPRTSSVSATSANIGSAIAVSISRASSNFTHTLRYSFGNLSGTIIDSTPDVSYSWTIPDSFYTQIPNSKTGWGTIWCDTYSGSTLIGTSSCVLNVSTNEASCKPTLSPTVADQGTGSSTLTGDANKIIRYYNTVHVMFNASAQNSATISSMKVVCGSSTRTSDGLMEYVDSGTFVFTVTDSRGYSASQTITKEIIDYIPLTCNLSANPDLIDGSTANINIAIKGNYFDGSFGAVDNSLTVEYRYKTNDGAYPTDEDGNEVWTAVAVPSNTTTVTYTESDGKNFLTHDPDANKLYFNSSLFTIADEVKIVANTETGDPLLRFEFEFSKGSIKRAVWGVANSTTGEFGEGATVYDISSQIVISSETGLPESSPAEASSSIKSYTAEVISKTEATEYIAQTVITGLDYTNAYTIQARAKDSVYTSGISTVEQVVRIVPVFDWGENDFNFNVPVHSKGGFTYDIPAANTDTNTIIISGKYHVGDSVANKPVNENGWLEVQSYGNGDYAYQKFVTYSGKKYERWRNESVWGSWKENPIDFITEQGVQDGWTYRKWNSGILEQWGRFATLVGAWNAWGSIYESSNYIQQAYAIPFAHDPVLTATLNTNDIGGWLETEGLYTPTSTPAFRMNRPTDTGDGGNWWAVSIYAIGTWK